jgi:integrase
LRTDVPLSAHDGSEHFTEDHHLVLWESIPPGLRHTYFTVAKIPPEYLGAFKANGDRGRTIDFRMLPEPIAHELAFCVWRLIELGALVPYEPLDRLARHLAGVLDELPARERARRTSLMTVPAQTWMRELLAAWARERGRVPSAGRKRDLTYALRRCYKLLCFAYDSRPWWEREVWDLQLDLRIPRREHEPGGTHALYFDRITQPWLRRGLQWHLRIGLETGQFTWSTCRVRLTGLIQFSRFLAERGVTAPCLREDPLEVRPLMLDYLSFIHAMRSDRREGKRLPLSVHRINRLMTDVEQFYMFMLDHRDEAAEALGDPRWKRLGAAHARFYRVGEKPRASARVDEAKIINDATMSRIMAKIHLLGDPVEEGGLGDQQAMRILLLVATTGRRLSEVLLLDREPILPPTGLARADGVDGFVAKLRYQQTKISDAPNTILIDADTVAVVRAQQQWADREMVDRGRGEIIPRYLFIGKAMNRDGRRPYPMQTLHARLHKFSALADLRDDQGRRLKLGRTHNFRHTRATSLINAGVPLPVVQRHFGHLSPTMTMRYVQISAEAQEREFLRFKKITADGRELKLDPADLYQLLELDKRANRILPNGWCLLPPRQVCERGNACLTCDKFATDASYLPEHEQQLDLLGQLIDTRKQAFAARTGHAMTDENVWLAERRKEQLALTKIIATVSDPELGENHAARGAGAPNHT